MTFSVDFDVNPQKTQNDNTQNVQTKVILSIHVRDKPNSQTKVILSIHVRDKPN